jgi:RimJ/RimL family protein N-acetyltransferase
MDFDLQPTLVGEHLTLRPLRPDDLEALWQAARDPLIWEQHPDKTRYHRAGFERYFAGLLAEPGSLAVVDNKTGGVIGVTRYYDWEPQQREVAIGYTFITRACWGGPTNREMKRLMIEHAAPHVDAIWFHVGRDNLRSRGAMKKLGATVAFEGKRPQNGEMIDFVYYRIEPARWLARN